MLRRHALHGHGEAAGALAADDRVPSGSKVCGRRAAGRVACEGTVRGRGLRRVGQPLSSRAACELSVPLIRGSPTKRSPSAARSPRLASCGSGPAQNRRTGPLPHVPKNERAPPKRSSFKGLSADPGSAGREGTLPEGLLKVRPGNRCRSGWPGSWQSCR